jgi:hypothetical protein
MANMTRRAFAFGLTLLASFRLTGAGAQSAPTGAARWLSQSTFVVSSLETGRIGYVVAWGGDEFGYAYTYALDGSQPGGVTVDVDTGVISIATGLAVGVYGLNIIVTNRRVASKVAKLAVTLQVVQGVTGNRSGAQIRHKTYDPHSGVYGKPQGSDWTAVFDAINAAILHDQIAQGDNNLRCYIPLRGGLQYNYTNNRWPCGAQFLTVHQDARYPGARPKLCCTQIEYNYDTEVAILQAGGGSFLDYVTSDTNAKRWETRINTCNVGDTTVTMKNPANASNLRVGRWHMVVSYDQQAYGGPPNSRYCDYVKIKAIDGSAVVLDRPLRHRHSDTFWERFPQDGISFGMARIMPMDVGGPTGVEAGNTGTNVRLTQRQTWESIEFVANPHFASPGDIGTVVYTQGLDTFFDNCLLPCSVPTITQHAMYVNGSISQRVEVDKLIETVIFDNITISGEGIGSSTGVEFWLLRNSKISGCTSAPRQIRTIRSTFDARLGTLGINAYLIWPAIPGPIQRVDFEGTTFIGDAVHTTGQIMPVRDTTVISLTLEKDGKWSGSRLIIPVSSAKFIYWLGMAFEGSIIFLGSDVFAYSSWGYITNITSPGNGSALWIDVNWVQGTMPASGTISLSRCHEVSIKSDCVLGVAGTNWGGNGGGFYKQTAPIDFGPSYDFPVGYPHTGW